MRRLSELCEPEQELPSPGRLRRHGSDLFHRPAGAQQRSCHTALLHCTVHCSVRCRTSEQCTSHAPALDSCGCVIARSERHGAPSTTLIPVANAGWAVAETSKKRGLLEDFRLQCEVGLSVAFESLRWAMRKALLLPGAHKPYQHQAFRASGAKVCCRLTLCIFSCESARLWPLKACAGRCARPCCCLARTSPTSTRPFEPLAPRCMPELSPPGLVALSCSTAMQECLHQDQLAGKVRCVCRLLLLSVAPSEISSICTGGELGRDTVRAAAAQAPPAAQPVTEQPQHGGRHRQHGCGHHSPGRCC